jgi:hypothetical protein
MITKEALRLLAAPNTPTLELAASAVALAAVIAKHQKVLDKIKPVLRERARAELDACGLAMARPGRVNWTTDSGSTSVTFPTPRWTVKNKDIDWESVKADLGADFDLYFKTRYSVVREIEEAVKQHCAEDGGLPAVTEVLTRDAPTPRVGFRPNPHRDDR